MPRIRTIKPELPQSESLGRVSREARLCFILLFTIADDFGKLRGNSRMLASLLYPYDDDAPGKIASWLTELEREGCVTQYAIEGNSYLKIDNWHLHQKVDRPTASKIPDPPETPREASRGIDESSRGLVVGSKDQGRDQGRERIVDLPARGPAPAPAREAPPPPPPERAGNIPTLDQVLGTPPPHAVEFHPRYNEVREYITKRLPSLGRQNASEVNRWLLSGADPEKDIFPSVDYGIEHRRSDIGSFRYFTRGIESSVATRKDAEEQKERLRQKFAAMDQQAEEEKA